MIDGLTQVYCILGHPVQHSFSPYLHNTGFAVKNIPAVYTAFDVAPEHLPAAVDGIRSLGIRGASVTIPHKVAVMPLLDDLDEIARMIGSVNLLYWKEGRLTGSNTDAWGFYQALSKTATLDDSDIALFGSGGAARAVCFSLFYYARPRSLSIYARPEDRQESLTLQNHLTEQLTAAGRLAPSQSITAFARSEWPGAQSPCTILINTTPLGMHPLETQSILSAEEIPQGITAMDIVYTPRETTFLRLARERGCRIGYGIDMLLYQGLRQFEVWTGQTAPEEEMRRILEERLAK